MASVWDCSFWRTLRFLSAIDRHPTLSDILVNPGVFFNLGYIQQINRGVYGGGNIFQQAKERQPSQAAVNQEVNVAFCRCAAFGVGTKSATVPVPLPVFQTMPLTGEGTSSTSRPLYAVR